MFYAWGREDVRIRFWWENLSEGDHFKDQGADVKIILKFIFEK
jgi:hypothetical protein